ncbi:TipAS antibiotic-recognition domain-containing protein [Ruminococcus sp. HUN007]|uniref:MerR family transcriptional regulator n=1 Tax=Ruminococcus sp. HUN007 TaxID=1514668 RepID=UPI001FA80726|nr:TipAS antibiotic-recognition domain-containing protein [Ruminococcus sp. HUN007]
MTNRTVTDFTTKNSLARMQEILFYRELDFPLKDILKILSSPDYDRKKALEAQKELMILKKNRIEKLISALDDAVKGVKINMKVFDNSEFEEKREEYAREAKEKWGNTEAYSEFEKKNGSFSTDDIRSLAAGIDEVMAEFAECMKNGFAPDSAEAKGLVRKLQNYITETSYTCTDEILAGLGQMYTADERFRKNIDRHGEGTAQFISDAIDKYCSSVK